MKKMPRISFLLAVLLLINLCYPVGFAAVLPKAALPAIGTAVRLEGTLVVTGTNAVLRLNPPLVFLNDTLQTPPVETLGIVPAPAKKLNNKKVWANGTLRASDTGYALTDATAGKLAAVKSVKLNQKKATLPLGKTLELTATVKPKTASQIIKWSSKSNKVASVSADGIVTANGYGKTTITAKGANGKKAACVVTVPVPVTGATISPPGFVLYQGKSKTLKVTAAPKNATIKSFMYASSNPSVATVSSKGVVKGKADGTATITATANDGSGVTVQSVVAVYTKKLDSLAFSNTRSEVSYRFFMTTGSKQQLNVYGSEEYGSPPVPPNSALTWSSTDPRVAGVSADGLVTAQKPGVSVIRADTGLKTSQGDKIRAEAPVAVTNARLKEKLLSESDAVLKYRGVSLRMGMSRDEVKRLLPGGKTKKKDGTQVYTIGKLKCVFAPSLVEIITNEPGAQAQGVGVGNSAIEVLNTYGGVTGENCFRATDSDANFRSFPDGVVLGYFGNYDLDLGVYFYVNSKTQKVMSIRLFAPSYGF